MHQHAIMPHEVGMIVFGIEIVDLNRGFKDFVLGLFQGDVLPVQEDQNVPGTEADGGIPTLVCYKKRMGRCGDEFCAVIVRSGVVAQRPDSNALRIASFCSFIRID